MIRWILPLLIAILLLCGLRSVGQQYYFVTAPQLNIRSGAGTNFPVIQRLNKGDSVLLLSTMENWGRMKINDTLDGYLSTTYLTTIHPDNEVENENATRTDPSTSFSLSKYLTGKYLLWALLILFGLYSLFKGSAKSKSRTTQSDDEDDDVYEEQTPQRKNTTSSSRQPSFTQSSIAQNHWWHCSGCGIKMNQPKEPRNSNSCTNRNFHKFKDYGLEGNDFHTCRNCGLTLPTKGTPKNMNECGRNRTFHNWQRL